MKFTELGPAEAQQSASRTLNIRAPYQENYETLFAALMASGSIVRRLGTLTNTADAGTPVQWKSDIDMVRFILPPQETELSVDASYSIGADRGKAAKRLDVHYRYDPEQVTGHLILQYCGVSKPPSLTLSDIHMPESVVPEELADIVQTMVSG